SVDIEGGRAAFTTLARAVKAWARARGLDSAPFGGLPGLAWTVLAARTVREHGPLPLRDLLRRFLGDLAAWDWRRPVALTSGVAAATDPTGATDLTDPPDAADATDPVTILTPTTPVRSCTTQVSAAGRDLLTQESYLAWEAAEAADALPWAALLCPPPLHRRHAAWAALSLRAVPGERFDVTLGRFRGRVRALLTALEQAGTMDAHAWPRPFDTGPDRATYAIGLGRTPPAPATLADLGRRWADGLPGVTVRWADGAELPTPG
ncbi:MAG TPA: poly(A) polymerase, partial [Micromonospora sp.]